MAIITCSSEQLGVLNSENNHNLVLALPGAGKTFTMTELIYKLVQDPDNRIVALTFTNAAANEMKHRVGKKVKGQKRKQIYVSTFHSLILEQTKRHKSFSGRKLIRDRAAERVDRHITESYRKEYGFYTEVTVRKLVTHNRSGVEHVVPKIKEIDVPFTRVCSWLIKEFKSTAYHEEIEFEHDHIFKHGIEHFYEYYLDQLAALNYWPLDVMCVEVTKALLIGDIAPLDCSHIIIDEFQDTDNIQYAWLKCHGIAGSLITVVGDDDQSVYSFRGALGVDGMRLFQRDFNVSFHTLSICFRCATEILDAAERLVSFNVNRIQKTMKTLETSSGELYLLPKMSKEEEVESITDILQENVSGSRAVLARTNSELDFVEGFLNLHGVDLIRLNGKSIWESDALKLYLHLLCTVVHVQSTEHLTQVLVFLNESQANIVSINSHLSAAGFADSSTSSDWSDNTQKLQQLCQSQWHLANSRDDSEMGQLIETVVDTFGSLMQKGEKSFSRVFTNILLSVHGCTLKERLLEMLRLSNTRSKPEINTDVVVLTTFHGAKGLEWDLVWLIGLDADNIPHKMPNVAANALNIEEERRLLYVAMTRAKSKLYMSWVSQPSKFLLETFDEVDLNQNL